MTKPSTIDEYIAGHDEPATTLLRELRALSRDAAPRTDESPRDHLDPRGSHHGGAVADQVTSPGAR
ncbi:hypothetical protein [Brachybacterium sp. FME24]|uniref:hypothetical protein n=1 Tax=Brachybacterium sp. FME24 TaxID=2742605 RepID=UPI00186810B9|nr:hypothetical protein [Brachybacterium sp. FME24]